MKKKKGQDKFDDNLDDDIEMKDDEINDNGEEEEEEGQDKFDDNLDDDIEMKDDEKSMIMVKKKKKMMMIINKIMKWIQPMKRNNYPKMKEEMLTMNSMVIMKSMKMSWNQIMKMMLLVKIMRNPTRK